MQYAALERPHKPDGQALIANLRRKGTPARVHHMELFHDAEVADALVERYNLAADLNPSDPWFKLRKHIALRRFLGFDYLRAQLIGTELTVNRIQTADTAALARSGGRQFMEEHRGPVTSWEEFEKYNWVTVTDECTKQLDWLQENCPDDQCLGVHTGHFAEYLCWLMGYETLCYALFDQRDLVKAIYDKVLALHIAELTRALQYSKVRIIWGSDDMGFKTGLLFSPADMREFVLPGHKILAKMAHDAGCVYLLHACGKLTDIIDDLADDVKIDGKHSFEDTIQDVRDAKKTYGRKIALIGGIDVDFLCRSDAAAIRKRVRETLDVCQSGGGYCLGTGNSVANYIPLDNYLAMIDEGWRYGS